MREESISRVVHGGYCVGCGACSVVTQARISIETHPMGWYVADLSRANFEELSAASRVCPFSDQSASEDEISERFLEPELPHRDRRLGSYTRLSAGRITDDNKVKGSSSGGLTTWLLEELLRRKMVDGVLHVASSDDPLFVYDESVSVEVLKLRGKSRYFAVEFSQLLARVRGNGKRYVFVGVPCFAKAIRLLCTEDAVLRDQISFVVGLVCGHMKSFRYAELLGWQQGIHPTELGAIDFRVKNPLRSSNSYDVSSHAKGGSEVFVKESVEFYGNNWGYAFMQLRACDFCDDVMGETADISFGDAWLPRFSGIWQGTNLVVSRSSELDRVLDDGVQSGELNLEQITADEAAATQLGNYRHRWDGLSVRQADAIARKEWAPRKRILPNSRPVPSWRRRMIRLREQCAIASHVEFKKAVLSSDLSGFISAMRRYTDRIERLYVWGKVADGTYWRKFASNPFWLVRTLRNKIGID